MLAFLRGVPPCRRAKHDDLGRGFGLAAQALGIAMFGLVLLPLPAVAGQSTTATHPLTLQIALQSARDAQVAYGVYCASANFSCPSISDATRGLGTRTSGGAAVALQRQSVDSGDAQDLRPGTRSE